MRNNVYSMLGLARKAGRLRSGGFLTEDAIRSRKAHLVILAGDAKDNTAGTIEDKCAYYHVRCCTYGTKKDLGAAIGTEERACVAVTDPGLAEAIEKLLDEQTTGAESFAGQGIRKERGWNGKDENQ